MKVVFLDAASRELHDAANYLDGKRAGLGEQFLQQVKKAELIVERFPHGGHPLGPRLRRIALPRFRYVLIYRLRDDIVEVIAISHERRHPRYWRSRLSDA